MVYSHTQVSNVALLAAALTIAMAVIVILVVRSQDGSRVPRDRVASFVALIGALVVGSCLMFSRMTITVDERSLSWAFALGLLHHSVPLSDLAAVSVASNSGGEGWGIHRTSTGTLYNVAGDSSVRVRLRDGSQFRLGTDQPDLLLQAIVGAKGDASTR